MVGRSRSFTCCLTVVVAVSLLSGLVHLKPAMAQIAMSGRFVAEARCPALQSIKKKSNPGTVSTDPGREYTVIGRNADPTTHYYLEFPGAEPDRRWVAIGCGRIETGAVTAQNSGRSSADDRTASEQVFPVDRQGGREDESSALASALSGGNLPANGATPKPEARSGTTVRRPSSSVPAGQYILAASWHPAFCEQRPNSRDCRSSRQSQTIDGFALHGFWPQPRNNEYCSVSAGLIAADRSGPWQRLPKPRLSAATRRELERVMPGGRSVARAARMVAARHLLRHRCRSLLHRCGRVDRRLEPVGGPRPLCAIGGVRTERRGDPLDLRHGVRARRRSQGRDRMRR